MSIPKVLAFSTSNSSKSINRTLVNYAASLIENAEISTLDIHDYEMPLYSSDREESDGIPEQAHAFYKQITEADALLISLAEHNGSYTAAYKNLYDWASRVDMKVYQDKPVVFLATSPGPGGASSVLAAAKASAPFFGADIKADLSIASFQENFDSDSNTFTDENIQLALIETVNTLAA